MKNKLENTDQRNSIDNNETPAIYEFVDRMFIAQGERNSHGDIRIEMVGEPRILIGHLYFDRDKDSVEVRINKKLMGSFNKYNGQGYKYKFQQSYRVGIRNGRTIAEQFMEYMCVLHNDNVLLNKAYLWRCL